MNVLKSKIQMVDLFNQYKKISKEIDETVLNIIQSTRFIKGPVVEEFEQNLAEYLKVKHVVSCGNGTDALQIALMALGLKPGDEIIVPAFTYVATAEVIALLRLKPIMVDVDPKTFNVTSEIVAQALTSKVKAIVPVHLYGQGCDMEPILKICQENNIAIIEDNAQAIGADYKGTNTTSQKVGTIGDIGCTSFFPSKNLGCFGDGGAMMTNSDKIADQLRMISNHGQRRKYYHDVIGVNSRLDAIQAGVLNVKLKYLDEYIRARQAVASNYDNAFRDLEMIEIPHRSENSSHVFHQYTLIVNNGKRNNLQSFLSEQGVPSMIYYPLPLYKQEAFKTFWNEGKNLPVTEHLCNSVLSLPIHTEMEKETLDFIISKVLAFFQKD